MIRPNKIFLRVHFTFSTACLLLICSCSSPDSKVKHVIEYWMSKEIIIPENLIYKSIAIDTISSHIFEHSYKILVYVDSVGCSGCRLGLIEWKAYIDRCQSKGYDVSFLFVIQSSDYKTFEDKLAMSNFNYPIIYDIADSFNHVNEFPKEDKFRTFLLDKDNKVVIVGSPIRSEMIWKLYNNVLSKTKNSMLSKETYLKLSKKMTTARVNQDSVYLGKFNRQIVKKVSFLIKNTGSTPLTIQKVNTSCGCTVAKYDKKPLAIGQTATVLLEYKPNSLGYFSKTADVVCNVPKGFVHLKISGEVVEK